MKDTLKILSIILLVIFGFINIKSISAQTDIKVACIGNSITIGAGTIPFPLQLDAILGNGWNVGNFGVSGRTLLKHGDFPYWNEQFFTDALNFQPDKVIIMLGTNDSKPYNWVYGDEFYADYLSMVDTFANLDSHPEIWVCHPLKAFSGVYDITDSVIFYGIIPLVDSVAAHRNVKVIDFYGLTQDKPKYYSDGVHPTSTGNNYLAEILFNEMVDSNMLVVHDKNVLLNRPVTTDNASNNTQDLLVDGDYANIWRTSGIPASATVDLGSEKVIDYFQLSFSTDLNRGYQYTIEGSVNASDWTMLADQSGRNDTISLFSADTISPTNLRYIRLTVTSFSNSSENKVKIPEFKALESTGFEHAPLIYMKRVSSKINNISIARHNSGDAISYYGATNDLSNFTLINFTSSKSSLINFNGTGTVGATNSYYTVHYYKGIKVISDTSTFTFYETVPTSLPGRKLEENIKVYPNPFSNEVRFSNLPENSKINIKIFDITGKLIRTIISNSAEITWDGKDMNSNATPAGIYVCSIESGDLVLMKKVIVRQK
jgi:acyl-CoA thioesterase-1